MAKFLPKQSGEILVLACDGHKGLHAANRLLKQHGLQLKWRGSREELGDQVYLRVEKIPC